MTRFIRQWFANKVLSFDEYAVARNQGFREPLVRHWLRREIWEPMKDELLGRYPPGHPYHQENPLIRYYPLTMTVAFIGMLMWVVVTLLTR